MKGGVADGSDHKETKIGKSLENCRAGILGSEGGQEGDSDHRESQAVRR